MIEAALKSARPLLAFRSSAYPLLRFGTLCTGSFAVGSRLPRTTAFIAIGLHTRTIGPHAFANGLLRRARDSSQSQSRENGRAINNSHPISSGRKICRQMIVKTRVLAMEAADFRSGVIRVVFDISAACPLSGPSRTQIRRCKHRDRHDSSSRTGGLES